MSGFDFRNAFNDIEGVVSRLAAKGADESQPVVSIVIPTFRRLDFLAISVASALRQDFDRPFRVVIVDDDPQSGGASDLLKLVPELAGSNFRYFVNEKNLGIYDNYNQGLLLSDSEWLVFLDDDDVLTSDFLSSLFRHVDRDPTIQAVMPSKTVFDERSGRSWSPEHRPLAWRLAKKALTEWNFLGRGVRRVPVGKFVWGAVIGGIGGLLFRREKVLEIGGLYSEEFPASDFWMMARFAKLYGLHHAREAGYRIRIRENETARPATVLKGLQWGHKLQTHLIGREVPRWYARLLPLIIAQHRAEFRDFWRSEVPREDLERLLGMRIPKERRVPLRILQTALRGF